MEVVRARKTGRIVRVTITPLAMDHDDPPHGGHGDLKLTYEEELAGKVITVLKRYDARTGQYVRWTDADAFDPFRFNPDRLPPASVFA